jgi:uncharacterized protein YjbI with pentapeptide repeats
MSSKTAAEAEFAGPNTGSAGQVTDGRAGYAIELETVLDRHQQWVASGWEAGKRADLHGRDLHTFDFRGAILVDADLHRADLHEAAMSKAELDGADLHRADLHGADLRGADLQWADLHGADLHNADLREAFLDEADLHGADLRGADLRRAHGLKPTQLAAATTDTATRLPDGDRP